MREHVCMFMHACMLAWCVDAGARAWMRVYVIGVQSRSQWFHLRDLRMRVCVYVRPYVCMVRECEFVCACTCACVLSILALIRWAEYMFESFICVMHG